MKKCSKCQLNKTLEEYPKNRDSFDGRRPDCTVCRALSTKKYYNSNKIKILSRAKLTYDPKTKKQKNKLYNEKNKEKLKIFRAEYFKKNKEVLKIRHKNWYEKNKEKVYLKNKEYVSNNRELVREKQRIQSIKRRLTSPQYRASCNLRRRLSLALKNNYKSGSAVRDLGCSIQELKVHLESKFQGGMTWGNYGLYGWHIDHIIPLSSFDLTQEDQFKKACHYSNLQPLWAIDNLKKSNKIEGLDGK